jgi:dienelactone hydrolase
METIQKPGLFLCAEVDNMFTDQMRKQAEEVLKSRNIKATFILYPGTQHGFAVRGNEHKEAVRDARRDALSKAIQFFTSELN